MCGIAGFSGGFQLDQLERATNAIAHRGPDDDGQWYDAEMRVGLCHRRLSIIDVSPAGHQPMSNPAGTVVIVFNGEIYNFRELRADLEAMGEKFRGHSDTEVLLSLYRLRGDEMLPMLNGIFAFAIWDVSRAELLLACDSMGVKPLYFSERGAGFVFASELKALLVFGGCGPLDVTALYRYLGFLWSPGGATPFKGVSRLGPGEALIVKGGRICRRWHWAASTFLGRSFDHGERDATGRVISALRTAVHRQMVADVPVGAFLSGGLDSSAVVALAREVSPGIECFTIDVGSTAESGTTDDLPYARQVAAHLKVRLHEIRVSSSEMASELERMVFHLDEPLADPASLNVFYISRLAREHGIKVLLSGAGGDDLFTGYRRHSALLLERYWTWLPLAARQRLRAMTSRLGRGGASGRRWAKAFAYADESADLRIPSYFFWASPGKVRELFVAEHREELSHVEMAAPLHAFLGTLPAGLPPLQRMLALEQRFFLTDHNLLYTDKMSMAVGVEVRVPFLDNELVRLANSLPTDLKHRRGEAKWILKKAMEPHLPRNVIYRPKTGFGAPLRHWLRNELREWVGDMLSVDTLRRRGFFDPAAVARLIEDDRAGRIDAAYTIFGLVCIEVWCRHFVDAVRVKGG